MCGVPRCGVDFDGRCLLKDGVPWRYLPPAQSLIDEIAGAGFVPLHWRVQENDWWDHLWMLAA
jgi:hypothetical protein